MKIVTLSPDDIIIGERYRKKDNKKYNSIRDSIAKQGVLNPILVTYKEGRYYLEAGETRLKACKELNIKVPCHIVNKDMRPEICQFIENFARADLEWPDEVEAIQQIHNELCATQANWTQTDTAGYLGVDAAYISRSLRVATELLTQPELKEYNTARSAYQKVMQDENRNVSLIVTDILLGNTQEVSQRYDAPAVVSLQELTKNLSVEEVVEDVLPPKTHRTVIHANFLEWTLLYDGPNFNVVHCDLPYGRVNVDGVGARFTKYSDTPDVYFQLLEAVLTYDKIDSDAVVMCWLDMKHYCATQALAKHCGWTSTSYPFILHKTNRSGFMPGKFGGRRTYEVMCMFYRGDPVILERKSLVGAHDVEDNSLLGHAEKPIDFLKDKLGMVVGEHARFLDPTCGSATALIAARELGCKYIVGVEQNETLAEWANARYIMAEMS